MGIKTVKIIHNPLLVKAFESRIVLLAERHGNAAFTSKWDVESKSDQERRQRQVSISLLKDMAKPHNDPQAPHVTLLPMWHGTRSSALESICKAGFANLALLDPGYFGRGLYNTGEANYAYRVYCQGALLVNWVSFFSGFPVLKGDMEKLLGKGNYQNYDAHFAPVVPVNPSNPQETVFHPCEIGQKHIYTELAVFDSAQVLPRYLVELQPDLPGMPCNPLIASPQMFEEELKESDSNVTIFPLANAYPTPKREVKLLGTHPSFIGRKEQLDALANTLLGKNGINTILLLGPPGIGKSELAVAFGNLYLEQFSFIWTMERSN